MSDEVKELKKAGPSVNDLDLEIKRKELALKELELKEKEANLQDLQERLAEREMKRENSRQRSYTNGQTLKQLAAIDLAAQKRCNHQKGGMGLQGIVAGQGDSPQYAVIKHTFCNGDMWVRCLRCGKTWKPPLKSAVMTEEAYQQELAAYWEAVNFSTHNIPSAALMYQFSDGGKFYREQVANSTLR